MVPQAYHMWFLSAKLVLVCLGVAHKSKKQKPTMNSCCMWLIKEFIQLYAVMCENLLSTGIKKKLTQVKNATKITQCLKWDAWYIEKYFVYI